MGGEESKEMLDLWSTLESLNQESNNTYNAYRERATEELQTLDNHRFTDGILGFLAKLVLAAATALVVFWLATQDRTNAKARPLVVSVVGDSITSHGCASSDNTTYPAQLQQILGEEKYTVTNYGVSGHTMLKQGLCGGPKCAGNCAYWNTPTYTKVMNSNPDIVTIMLGTNDAKGCNWYGPPNGSPSGLGVEFRSDFLDMVSKFKSLPSNPKVYLLIPPPLVNPPNHPDSPPVYGMTKHVINEMFPNMVASIAVETGADGVIDIWTALGGEDGYAHTDMTCDGCHPKDKAMTIIAKTIANAITADNEDVEWSNSRWEDKTATVMVE